MTADITANSVAGGAAKLDTDGTPLLFEDDTPILGERVMLCLWGEDPPLSGPIRGTSIDYSEVVRFV